MENSRLQWFIITAIGGKEDSIKAALIEKLHNFGYEDHVKEIKIFKQNKIKEEIFSKTDPSLPKSMKNTKTTKWEVLPDGRYKRTKIKVVNKFPGYIFINMIMDKDVWYTIRNTAGVMGFVGSSGKGALPIPISIAEYDKIASAESKAIEESTTAQPSTEPKQPEATVVKKTIHQTDLRIGDTVQITVGAFAGTVGVIRNLDTEKGVATIEVEFFGRVTNVDAPFSDIQLDQ